ncbi:MAG: type II toxin-antitoxin system VapC family toxin [Methylacidiphilales bacterium]|nr:type II toxin-antitoxin system VapC family toxin [Candidatus Methylacidiphilales bacterium]
MKVYFDTGLLLKIYSAEPNSAQATVLVQSYGTPIIFCQLQQTELRNALYRKAARHEIDQGELARSLKRIQFDLDHGVLQIPHLEWPELWANADQLTAKYALATQCRTLDVLHVAVAMQLDIKTFATTDARQKVVARKAGLSVVSLS